MKITRLLASGLICAFTLGSQPSFAAWDEYDDSQSHPLRVLAYLSYPLGWLAEWTVFRPLHLIVSTTEPQEAFFGHRPHPPLVAENQGSSYYDRDGTPATGQASRAATESAGASTHPRDGQDRRGAG